jgi:4-hydroxybenzoate polyprenyltransferase
MTATSKCNPWLQLLRVPNLFTVPGDPVAGFLLVMIGLSAGENKEAPDVNTALVSMLLAALSALLLYGAGLLANDYFDLEEDSRERPNRPLPSGDVRPGSAMLVALVLVLGGIGAAYFAGGKWTALTAAILAGVIILYDAVGKRIPVLGSMTMGTCRGLSALVGAMAAAEGCLHSVRLETLLPAVGFAVGLTLYIAAVTSVSKKETGTDRVGVRRFLPVAAMFVWVVGTAAGTLFAMAFWLPSVVLLILACGWTISCAASLKGQVQPGDVQRTIGKLIRALLLVQAAVAAMMNLPGWVIAAVLLVFWPLSAIVGKRFYAS